MQQNPFGADPMGGMFGGLLGGLMGGMMMPPMPPVGAGGAAGVGQQGPQVFSYSSSSVMRAGPDGVYHSSTTSRQAPGGVSHMFGTVHGGYATYIQQHSTAQRSMRKCSALREEQ